MVMCRQPCGGGQCDFSVSPQSKSFFLLFYRLAYIYFLCLTLGLIRTGVLTWTRARQYDVLSSLNWQCNR